MSAYLRSLAAVLTLCMLMVLPGIARAENTAVSETTLEHILKTKTLRVGIVLLAPLAMLDKQARLVGLEVDMARRLADDLGVSLELAPVPMPEIITGLTDNRYDLVISGCGITPEKALRVNFTTPYYYTDIHLVASKQVAPGKNIAYFDSPDITLGMLAGHSETREVEKRFPQAAFRFFDSEDALLDALLSGKIPAAVVSDQLIRFNVAFHANKLYLPDEKSLTTEPVAMAVRKNDYETLQFLNSWISILKGEDWVAERRAFWYEQSSWMKDVPNTFP